MKELTSHESILIQAPTQRLWEIIDQIILYETMVPAPDYIWR